MLTNKRLRNYPVIAAAGQFVNGVIPANPKRVLLVIQNTGVNPGRFRFEQPVQNDAGDQVLASMERVILDNPDTCPAEGVNFLSDLGTTFAVIETTAG